MVILMFNSLDLCSFMDMSFTSVLIWIYICSFMDVMFNQPIYITERRSTHVRIRIHGRARTSIARPAELSGFQPSFRYFGQSTLFPHNSAIRAAN